jgi:DNA invertase Pin-like site-specific DNA recombinase
VKLGYCRVSTGDQTLETQRDALKADGCERIYEEKASGKNVEDRPELQAVLGFMREGDVLTVTKLDRLARSVRDLMDVHDRLKEKGCALRILNMNLDTATPTGKLMLGVLGSIAEFERDLILERQREGIDRVKRNAEISDKTGRYKYAGPPIKHDAAKIREMRASGMGPAAIAREIGCSQMTVFRALKVEGAAS